MDARRAKALGETLRDRRGRLRMTQRAAAEAAGLSPSRWRDLERGRLKGGLRAPSVAAIADAMGWPHTWWADLINPDADVDAWRSAMVLSAENPATPAQDGPRERLHGLVAAMDEDEVEWLLGLVEGALAARRSQERQR